MANSRTEAKNLPCLFKFLAKDYLKMSLPEYFCDFEIQVSLPNPKYENLITKFESLIKKIDKLEHLNQQLLLENDLLKKRLNNKYNNQQEHIKAIVEIAK
ncbi:12891_t:CDS:2 [Gigaspora margarita]|uniref:12891_t:CDS:1 n=1 Tax=Gigaspora margarita TaxID=4874 RepID=A0ABN7UFX0_GIGMA|nr:12891_t:CDS:2 [Gigaspora margarita]